MITTSSRRLHRVDTRTSSQTFVSVGMQNLNNTPSLGPLSARDFAAPRVVPTRRSLWFRLVRACRLRMLGWQLDCLRAEREQYLSAGMVGRVYMRNSYQQELDLRARIRELEQA